MDIYGGFCLGFYWGSRKEDAPQCAKRIWRFLSELRGLDPALEYWFCVDNGGQREPVTDPDALRQYIAKCVNRDDVRHQPIPELGFRCWLLGSTCNETTLTVQMSLGKYDTPIPNNCLIFPPSNGKESDRFLRFERILELGTAVVKSFEPDDGVFGSAGLDEKLDFGIETPSFGWIVYLSHKYDPIPPLPASIEKIPCDDAGTFLVVSKGPFSADNKEDLARMRKLRSLLQKSQKPPVK